MKKALPILLFMLLMFISLVGFITYYIQDNLAPIDNKAATAWWNPEWKYRINMTFNSGDFNRINVPVEKTINFTQYLNNSGSGEFDEDSIRVVEVAENGGLINSNVPFQFDKSPNYNAQTNASGELVWIVKESTAKNTDRYYQVYFDLTNKNFSKADFEPLITTTDNVNYKEFQSIRIETQTADYYYHKTGGGFASLIDKEGNDWINWNSQTGARGDFRGIPNMVHPNDGGHFHPGRNTVTTNLVDTGPIKTTFSSKVGTTWEILWEVYPEYVEMTTIKVPSDKKYWFLYEGVPGGVLELENDTLTRSDGDTINASEEWTTDIVGDEWVFVSDGTLERSLFLINHNNDEYIDSYKDMDPMTIFGFGRSGNNRYLTSNNYKFTLGLIDKKDFASVKTKVESTYKEKQVTVGDFEENEGGTPGLPTQTPTITPSELPTITPTINLSITPSLTPSPTMTMNPSQVPSNTPEIDPTSTITVTEGVDICGKADINNDGIFTIADFAEFAKKYGTGKNSCSDKDVDYGICGGRDINRDGKLNIADFGAEGIGFAQRYYPKSSCSI